MSNDRLIARMILGIGLSLCIANTIACGVTHPKFSVIKKEFWSIKELKDAYLDTFEQSDEFKTAYNAYIQSLNNRLIAREIDAHTYESELAKLNDNTYTEQVLLANANYQTKAEFNEIYQKYLDANDNWDKNALPIVLTSMGTVALPLMTAGLYYTWKPSKKEEFEEHHQTHISPEVMKKVMQIPDIPYGAIGYPIDDGEKQENKTSCNENCLGTRYYDSTTMTIRNTNEDNETLSK